MGARLRSWWQRIKGPLEAIIVIAFLVGLVVLIILIILGYRYNWDWTGLGPVNSEPKQHMKTLWDWLQLLIIPAVLAVGGYVFNLTVSRNEQKSTQLRDQTERDIAEDNQREAVLQEYIDKMSELLLDKNLRESTEDAEVRKIARVRTLTALRRLDAERKGSVLQFLHESDLISKDTPIIHLTGADLSGANLISAKLGGADLRDADMRDADMRFANLMNASLSGADLRGANLSEAYLNGADLFEARLEGADLRRADLSAPILSKLSGAKLEGANLVGVNLRGANLSEANLGGADLADALVTTEQLTSTRSLQGAMMPDGSIHP